MSSRHPPRVGILFVGFSLLGCRPATPQGPSRAEVLESLATTVIVPNYAQLRDQAPPLVVALQNLCATTNASTLAEAQDAWRNLRRPLKRTEMHALGPVEDQRFTAAIDFWPARIDAAEASIASGVSPTPQYLQTLGVASKGLPIIEYLIFDPEEGTEGTLARLDATTEHGAHRCAYATALGHDVQVRTLALYQAWDPNDGDWVTELSDPNASSHFMSARMALAELVNRLAFGLQDIGDTKLIKPLGGETGGLADPTGVEARFSDHSVEEILANLAGFEALYAGVDEGLGLSDIVLPLDAQLDADIFDQLQRSRQAFDKFDRPLRRAIIDTPDRVHQAHIEVRELRRLIEVDMAGLMGVTISLNDNDGD